MAHSRSWPGSAGAGFYPERMTEMVEPGKITEIVDSEAPRDEKLRELSKLIRGTDEPANVPELLTRSSNLP